MFVARAQNPPLAATLILIASAFIAATTLMAKALGTDAPGDPLHPFQITFGRFLFAFLTFVVGASGRRPQLQRPHLGLHLARTLSGAAGVTLMFASVAYIPLADATASGLEALAGPEIADGATAGAYLETLASEHHSDPAAEPFAAQAIVRARTDDGMAQGPAAIAYPDPAEPLEVHFGWAEESYEADADILLLRGFETSRARLI